MRVVRDRNEAVDRRLARCTSKLRNLIMADTKSLDAVALLKADHRTVEELFEKFEKASGEGKKQAIAEQICMELTSTPRSRKKSSIRRARARSRKICSRKPMSSMTAPRY